MLTRTTRCRCRQSYGCWSSTMTRWVKQLRDERQGKTPKASPITPEQIEIRELRKKLHALKWRMKY
ncbi:transposase [Shigella dysenteriae]|uniref:transposase n=1 Tax=Shigella dysenteriae TaxID=622 RepID=UPI00351A8A74